jgi:hypothetical protein
VSSTAADSLVERRQSLRRRLQAQRRVIAQQLEPESAMSYPRSRTMRFLTGQPAALIVRLLVGFATVLRTK